ncbi:MAG: (d)CMP kinase [Caulobacteraceae bacterium]
MGFVVAIDGPAASGKGVLAAALGQALGFPVLDSGLLYRAVGRAVTLAGGDPGDAELCARAAEALDPTGLDAPDLRTAAAGDAASRVAAHPGVRRALLDFQRAFAAREPGAILDGRDIGTAIVPAAPAKLYVTASPEVRAERRRLQLAERGEAAPFADILADIEARDRRDGERAASPMRAAPDAVLLDTSKMSMEDAFVAARRIVEAARARWESP